LIATKNKVMATVFSLLHVRPFYIFLVGRSTELVRSPVFARA